MVLSRQRSTTALGSVPKADIAVADYSGYVSVLLGRGDGTFQSAVNYSAGSYPRSVAVGDFNGDGKADLVVADDNGGNVSVLLGNGDGSFQAGVTYQTGGQPSSVAVADFNKDGRTDLAVVNYGPNNVSILLGVGASGPGLIVGKTHAGNFRQGQMGASYLITVSNQGQVATSGAVMVTDNLPSGLTATAINGAGWACALDTLTCARSDALAAS